MKTKLLITSFLVFILGSSFIGSDYYKKEILFIADIVVNEKTTKKKVEVFVNTKRSKVVSLTVHGYLDRWLLRGFGPEGSLNVKELDTTKNNRLKISESIDKLMSVELSKNFSNKGGLIYVNVELSNGSIQKNNVYVSCEKNKYVAYLDSINTLSKIKGLNINISVDKDDNASVNAYTIKTESGNYLFPKNK